MEADEWIQYLTKSIEYANSKNIKNIEESRIDDKKTGWMEKKGVKRWFILTLDQLQWFENDTSTKCKNSLPLYCCSVNEVSKVRTNVLKRNSLISKYSFKDLFYFNFTIWEKLFSNY